MTTQSSFRGLAPLVSIVFLGFLAVGIPLAALPLRVHDILGASPLLIGLIAGAQSLATVVSRHRAGVLSDERGPRRAVLIGLPVSALAGVLYLLSTTTAALPLLLAGRIALGVGESLFITGAMSWGIARLGPAQTGKVMSWQGIAMYTAIAAGAPLGLWLQRSYGFTAMCVASAITPLLGCLVAQPLAGIAPIRSVRVPFYRVLGLIWHQGVVLALAAAPFAAMAAFLAIHYREHGWSGAGVALALFGAGYVLVRLLLSHAPNTYGAVRVAVISLVVEALGQCLLWQSTTVALAHTGACLTGIGFSLVFPAMGVEATRNIAPEMRGRAVGNFIAFFDVAVGVTGPLVGLVIGPTLYGQPFLIGMLAALGAVAMLLSRRAA